MYRKMTHMIATLECCPDVELLVIRVASMEADVEKREGLGDGFIHLVVGHSMDLIVSYASRRRDTVREAGGRATTLSIRGEGNENGSPTVVRAISPMDSDEPGMDRAAIEVYTREMTCGPSTEAALPTMPTRDIRPSHADL